MTALATPPAVDRFAHQEPAIQFALQRDGTIFDAGMSAGKTKMYIEVAERIDAGILIVLCPDKVRGVFPREIAKHSRREWLTWNGTVHGARGPLVNPTVAQRATALVRAHGDAIKLRRPLAMIVNYEACHRLPISSVLLALAATPGRRPVLILDESHRTKAPGGRASRFAAQLGDRVRRHGGKVIGGTGTFCPHDELDAYAQGRAVDPTVLGTSFARVKARYGAPKVKFEHADGTPEYLTTPNGQLIYEGVREDRREEYARLLARFVYRIDQATIDANLGLTDPVETTYEIDLDPATRRAYNAMERDLIAEVDAGVVTAANSMQVVLRLAQIASGYAPDADDGHVHRLSDPPELARLLTDVLADDPGTCPVVVFARFHHDLDEIRRVAERTGRRYGELSGRRRDGLREDSTMAHGIDLLACQVRSGGTGVDLTRSHRGIYYTPTYDLADHLQSRRRLLREGQQHTVELAHLVSAEIHRRIYRALHRRERLTTAFLDYMKETSR
jgi:hypothetical protein